MNHLSTRQYIICMFLFCFLPSARQVYPSLVPNLAYIYILFAPALLLIFQRLFRSLRYCRFIQLSVLFTILYVAFSAINGSSYISTTVFNTDPYRIGQYLLTIYLCPLLVIMSTRSVLIRSPRLFDELSTQELILLLFPAAILLLSPFVGLSAPDLDDQGYTGYLMSAQSILIYFSIFFRCRIFLRTPTLSFLSILVISIFQQSRTPLLYLLLIAITECIRILVNFVVMVFSHLTIPKRALQTAAVFVSVVVLSYYLFGLILRSEAELPFRSLRGILTLLDPSNSRIVGEVLLNLIGSERVAQFSCFIDYFDQNPLGLIFGGSDSLGCRIVYIHSVVSIFPSAGVIPFIVLLYICVRVSLGSSQTDLGNRFVLPARLAMYLVSLFVLVSPFPLLAELCLGWPNRRSTSSFA